MKVLVRGGGDLASGSVIRMARAGWQVLVTELPQPLAVRRLVSFAQAVYAGEVQVEEVWAELVQDVDGAQRAFAAGRVAVMVDPGAICAAAFVPDVIVDGRMRKLPPEGESVCAAPLIGLGPGFWAGRNCAAVVETNRGPFLGRVIWEGCAQPDTGIPERVLEQAAERVLRAPVNGELQALSEIGQLLHTGDPVARVAGQILTAPFDGILRGLLQTGLPVRVGMKVGDLDPRSDPRLCWMVSEKALAIGGGVLEAVLTWFGRRRNH